ncbi:hypothetical protein AB0A05_07490 [Streptomyces sp. NPDC046374]|uniref:hypothetical protein n=1 Tax=Streptomyces sp. NPDC046374 TaxID=3154917 RepID=UPI0033F553B3
MPRKPGVQPKPAPKLSETTKAAINAWERYVKKEEKLRKAAQKALAQELIADPDLPVAALANLPEVPWGIGTLRIICAEYKVPPRQPNKAKRDDDGE